VFFPKGLFFLCVSVSLWLNLAVKKMQIKQLTNNDITPWNEFVFQHPDATFFHRAEWKEVIERAFSHTMYFFFAEDEGEIVGVLPLGHVKSRIFGNSLVSIPFYVYGGILAKNEDVYLELAEKSKSLAKELDVGYLEFRNIKPQSSDWPVKNDLYATFRKEIAPDADQILKSIPGKQRAVVRKGIKAGLISVYDEDVDRFYESYATTLHSHGTPAFPRKLFHILKEVFKQDCDILSIYKDDRMIASLMSFYFKDTVLPYYAGTSADSRVYNAHHFMYWELMRRSSEKGYKCFDFGRSKVDTGAFKFKTNWGFEPEYLNYEYYLVNATEIPDVNPNNPKYSLFIKAWQKMPFAMTKVIGPYIVRNLG